MNSTLKQQPNGDWNAVPPVPAEKINNVNCHKFVLYSIGQISWDELISDPKEQKIASLDFTYNDKVKEISHLPFTYIEDFEALISLANSSCVSERRYVGQIQDSKTYEMAHSFIIVRNSTGDFVCYDKPGFKYPFAVHGLSEIYNFVNKDGEKSNQNQNWRFVPI